MAAPSFASTQSAFARRARLFECICRGELGSDVLRELLPGGEGLLYEKALWDYKSELPVLRGDHKPSDAEKHAYLVKMSEIVKDAVSFYNSYGGYVVAGVDDRTRKVTGFDGRFDCDELVNKIQGATRHEVDCHYSVHELSTANGMLKLGLLFVPRRPYSRNPAQFLRDAPQSSNGKQAYKANQIYFRFGDQCKAAQTSEDYGFLCGAGRRELSLAEEFKRAIPLNNNLGPRDPGFIKFVGRENYLRELWRWVCDGYVPVKLVAGIGGVGKTTLVREFSEDITWNAPSGLEKLIWLSAKKQIYTAILGKYEPTLRVDFFDLRTLLQAILAELGYAQKNIDPEWSQRELFDECVSALRMFPALVIVDDVDSLEPMQQQEVFQTLIQLMTQTVGRGSRSSLALMTARLELGAAPGQLMRVSGLELHDFANYVAMTADALAVPLVLKPNSQLMQRFRDVTDGSPLFAAAVIRLLTTGENLDLVLRRWKGADGEDVRKFAFKKELDNLSESQVRTLYAACRLGVTSFVELQNILQSSDRLMANDIGELRKYHLVALGEDLPGGARIIVPTSLQLLTDIVRERVRDPKRLERECAKVKAGAPRIESEIGEVVRRVTALWQEDRATDALDLALVSNERYRDNPDLKCLLGRAYLRINPPDAASAEVALHRAHELKCSRPELASLWIQSKSLSQDWVGVIEVTHLFPETANLIVARCQSYLELGKIAVSAGNLRRAAEQWLAGGREVGRAFKEMRARGREAELTQLGRWLFEHHIAAIDSLMPDPNERIHVWYAIVAAFGCYVPDPRVVKLGVDALAQWWTAVEQRNIVDTKAHNLLRAQLKELDAIVESVAKGTPDHHLLVFLNSSRRKLQQRCNSYLS